MITGIHHINVVVTDLKQAVQFFKLFNFNVMEEKELSGSWIDNVTGLKGVKALYAGLRNEKCSTAVELLQYISPGKVECPNVSDANAVGIRHFAFKTEDIDKVLKNLASAGTEFLGELQTNPYGKRMIYIKGPDGIIVELAEIKD